MEVTQTLKRNYPWIETPLVVGAPMRLISLADLAVEVSKAGGVGFIGAGTDVSNLQDQLERAKALLQPTPISTKNHTLPIGVGFINWGASLKDAMPLIQRYKPAAVWFFAPTSLSSLQEWVYQARAASPETQVWIQIGSVKEALEVLETRPDVLVVQGTDAGGHGLVQGAGIVSLVPEVMDRVNEAVEKAGDGWEGPVFIAAGGIADARGVVAALALGAGGVVMGTRFLAAKEAVVSKGYRDEILRTSDGGQTTVRTKVYDTLRGTTGWADTHNARGVINKSYTDHVEGMEEDKNKKLYEEEMKKGDEGWGVEARMTTYAGSVVGLVKEIKPAGEIVTEVRGGAKDILQRMSAL